MSRIAVFLWALASVAYGGIPNFTLSPIVTNPQFYPRYLATAPDGSVWFSEEQLTPHSIGFITPAGKVTKFQVPCTKCANGDELIYIDGLAIGPDGNAWFNYTHVGGDGSPLDGGFNNFIGRYTPAGAFTSFPVQTQDAFRRFVGGSFGHSAITAGPDGNVWFAENSGNKVGKITPAGTITEFALPGFFSSPSVITSGPDGNVWFTETSGNKIGRITPAGALTEFPLGSGKLPLGITSGPDGNLWFTELAGKLGRITPAGVITEFATDTGPIHITTGADGNLWFTLSGVSNMEIAQFLIATGSVSYASMTLRPFDITPLTAVVSFAHGRTRPLVIAPPMFFISAGDPVTGKDEGFKGSTAAPNCVPPLELDFRSDEWAKTGYRTFRTNEFGFNEGSILPILVNNAVGHVTIEVTGNLPPGFSIKMASFGPNFDLVGDVLESAAPGKYVFTIRASDERPCTAEKTLTAEVLQNKGLTGLEELGIIVVGGFH